MKKLVLLSLLTLSAGITQADTPRLVNADGSGLSAICIAAVTSREAMYDTAAKSGVRPSELSTVRCNGMTVRRFVSTYREAAEPVPVGYVFSKSDNTPVTELCVAAVRSEQEYLNVKERYFGDDAKVEEEVRCNGLPLLSFARKYRTPGPTVSLR